MRGFLSFIADTIIVGAFAALVFATVLASCANGATLRLRVVVPSFNADNGAPCGMIDSMIVGPDGQPYLGSPLTDLKELRIYGKRFVDTDTLYFGVIPNPTPGDTIDYDLDILDGSMGTTWNTAVDHSGNESCRGGEHLFALPLTEVPAPSGQPGLRAEFYRGINFNAFEYERIDSAVAFDLGRWTRLWPGAPLDTLSARWTGILTVPTTGTWTLYVDSDDGCRLWVDGVKVQDFWAGRSAETATTLALSAGHHPVRLEYFESFSVARCRLSWSGPGVVKQAVPAWALSH